MKRIFVFIFASFFGLCPLFSKTEKPVVHIQQDFHKYFDSKTFIDSEHMARLMAQSTIEKRLTEKINKLKKKSNAYLFAWLGFGFVSLAGTVGIIDNLIYSQEEIDKGITEEENSKHTGLYTVMALAGFGFAAVSYNAWLKVNSELSDLNEELRSLRLEIHSFSININPLRKEFSVGYKFGF